MRNLEKDWNIDAEESLIDLAEDREHEEYHENEIERRFENLKV